jgi:hypothetical protein
VQDAGPVRIAGRRQRAAGASLLPNKKAGPKAGFLCRVLNYLAADAAAEAAEAASVAAEAAAEGSSSVGSGSSSVSSSSWSSFNCWCWCWGFNYWCWCRSFFFCCKQPEQQPSGRRSAGIFSFVFLNYFKNKSTLLR